MIGAVTAVSAASVSVASSAFQYQSNWWEVFSASFFRHAILGGTAVALAAGLIGYFVIVRGTSFAAHALAHIGLPGATGAVLLGLPVTLGLGVFCVGGAVVIGVMGKKAADREVATGTILAFATGLGLLFNSMATQSSSTLTNVLFGNLLAISTPQLIAFTAFLALVIAAMAVIHRPLLFASVNDEVAEAKGVPVAGLSIAFMVLLGLVITMAVQVVGTLLLFALVVTPAATAIMLTPRPGRAMAVATALNLVAVWGGLLLSVIFNLPPSFVIVTIACAAWLVVYLLARSPAARLGLG